VAEVLQRHLDAAVVLWRKHTGSNLITLDERECVAAAIDQGEHTGRLDGLKAATDALRAHGFIAAGELLRVAIDKERERDGAT